MRRLPLVAMLAGALLLPTVAGAQVLRVDILSREPLNGGAPIGAIGPYERIRGRITGEVDPTDPHNAIIMDLSLAPRNARGRVEYTATFALAKPVDMAKASGVLIYSVVNRGNGDVFPSADGHVSLVSGWQGDVVPTASNQTIAVPVAHGPDGAPLTGLVLARVINPPAGGNTVTLRLGSMGNGPPAYPPDGFEQPQATLISLGADNARGERRDAIEIPRSEWALADCRTVAFPGTPDGTRLCLKGGFDPSRLYELRYTVRDPLVLGVGFAATRDIVTFFHHAKADTHGVANPVAGAIRHVVSIGDSQSGNFIRSFIHLGFNEDLEGRLVWDGAFPRIAARQTPMIVRFAVPGGAASLYEPGSDGVVWWGTYRDAARGLAPASLLDRCTRTRTCPKIVEAFGAAEFWGLRMSPDLVGTDAAADIPLPANVRRYYYPGTTHGGGRGGFRVEPDAPAPGCVLPANPNPQSDTTRALTAALVDWVVRGVEPPPSRYPLLSRGELVTPEEAARAFASIPGVSSPAALVNPLIDYDFGAGLDRRDLTGVIANPRPERVRVLPTLVPRVGRDGNEDTGVPSVLHQAPLGTYVGWNVTASGFFKGQGCGFAGGFMPFARTRADRERAGDPRLSLEERYGTQQGYVCAVRRAAETAVSERFLLPADATRIITEATTTSVLPAESGSPEGLTVSRALCSVP